MVEFSIWIAALASLVILMAAIKLYQLHHENMPLLTRMFFAAIALSAIFSVFEILAWRRPIPLGMTAFLVLLAVGWAMRAFTSLCLLPSVLATAQPARRAAAANRNMAEDRPVFSYQDRAKA